MKKLLVLALGTTMVLSSSTLAFARGGMMGNDSNYRMAQSGRGDFEERGRMMDDRGYRNEEFDNYMLDKGYTFEDMRNFTRDEMLEMHAEFEGVSVDELLERGRQFNNDRRRQF